MESLESDEEVITSADTENSEEEAPGSETGWNWTSRSRLVELVHVNGKNWGAILIKLHDEHYFWNYRLRQTTQPVQLNQRNQISLSKTFYEEKMESSCKKS
jgi:hypothetical protein